MSTLNVIWNKFTEPPPSIQDSERHRQARLLSSLLLALIVVSTLSVIADVITGQLAFQTFGDYMPVIGVVALVGVYGLSRTQYYVTSAIIFVGILFVVIGVGFMDSGIVNHLNKTIQAARLKGARVIVTGISDAVAETIVDLGIDWSGIETLSSLQTGLVAALQDLGIKLNKG